MRLKRPIIDFFLRGNGLFMSCRWKT